MTEKPEMIDLSHIRDWVFDLDNTLYPRRCDLFAQIDLRMTAYVSNLTGLEYAQARRLQKDLYRRHGTTLSGLMREHHIDPHHFLNFVHDIDYSGVAPDRRLNQAIAALPGRKHIFTNGDSAHAERTLAALGIDAVFDSCFDIIAAGFDPKPGAGAYDRFISLHSLKPQASIMFEDMPRNLEVAKARGMTTVLVSDPEFTAGEAWEIAGHGDPFIDYRIEDVGQFLADNVPFATAEPDESGLMTAGRG